MPSNICKKSGLASFSFSQNKIEINKIELSFELLPNPPYSPDLTLSGYWLFADLKKMLRGKRFGSNEEVNAETKAYFKSKDKSFYKKCIEKVEKRWNECITLE